MKVLALPACRVLYACLLAALAALLSVLPQSLAAAQAASTQASTIASRPASTRPTTTTAQAPMLPDAGSFKVRDEPGDDGSNILVQWAKPENEIRGVKYVVEIARSPADFGTDKAKEGDEVEPSKKSLASAKPECFGYGKENQHIYFDEISPADLFKPAEPKLDNSRLQELAADGKLSGSDLARAKAALALDKELDDLRRVKSTKPDKLTKADKAILARDADLLDRKTANEKDLKWFARLKDYLKRQDSKQLKAEEHKVDEQTWYFRLRVVQDGAKAYVCGRDGKPIVLSASAKPHWFKLYELNNLIFSLIFCGVIFAFIQVAKRRPNLFIRKIGGLEAVDEAIGRSTEMDRPVFFVHGLADMDGTATIAAVNILGRVARRTAEHDSRIRVMNNYPIVTAVSQEVVQQAYAQAGRPDAFNPDDVSLVASDQFSYVAAVAGNMVREQPGAIFMLGSFFAESLMLAETGASTGAIQIAGTDQNTQLPFFITTCDYTLMGEELFAASAYLSREPRMLGSLRGQDVGKAFLMIVLVLIPLILTIAAWAGWDFGWLQGCFSSGKGSS